jgi:hypothetical protein
MSTVETKWLKSINASSSPTILAIVINANLESGNNVKSILKAYLEANSLDKGVRETLT